MQTKTFKKMGVTVKSLNVANQVVPRRGMEEALDEADIILVSGGNTLFAIDRWEYLGLGDLLRDAALSGKVMAGGSAGAICWFDGGHSDSMDPETYRACMLNKFGEGNTVESRNPAESSSSLRGCTSARSKSKSSYDVAEEGETDVESDDESTNSSDWEYIRVEGLGIMPGTLRFGDWCTLLSCQHSDNIVPHFNTSPSTTVKTRFGLSSQRPCPKQRCTENERLRIHAETPSARSWNRDRSLCRIRVQWSRLPCPIHTWPDGID